MSTFDTCLAFTLLQEGGWSDNSADPGGATMKGITLVTYRNWMGNQTITPDQLRAIPDDVVSAIYGADYWNPVRGDDLPPAIAVMVFDFGVNAGIRASAQALQHAVGVAEDGEIGPMTLAAVGNCLPTFLVGRLASLQMTYYRGLTNLFPTFGAGWTARTDHREAAAAALLPGADPGALLVAMNVKPHPQAAVRPHLLAA